MSTIFLLSIPSPSSSCSLFKSNFNGRIKTDHLVKKVDVVRLYARHQQTISMIIMIQFLCWIMSATTTTMAASAAITYDELYHHQQQQRNHKNNQEKPHSKGTFEDSGGSSSTFADLHTSSSLKRFMPTNDEPEFVGQIPNLTVSVGRDAKFPCIVNNLDTYRVGWIKNEDKAILTIQHQVVTRNNRISLTQSEHKIWTLHIKNVQESDRGGYMCQINTMPMKSQIGYLDVTVPPDFINSETSSDVMVRENQNLTLKCKARGHPEPKLTWRREDNKPIEYGNWQINKESGMEYPISIESNTITINKVSRLHMGAYLCIAQNGVPPSVSRRIVLQVNFPPMIWVPNQLLGASIGDEIALECDTEAFPLSLNYWTKEEKNHQHQDSANGGGTNIGNGIGEEIMIVNSDKYRMSNTENSYKVHMKLIIKKITSDDFGTYRCHAKNSLGSTQGSIRIYEIHRTVSSKPSPSSSSTNKSSSKEPSTARIQSLNDSSHKNDPNEEYYSTANAAAAHHTVFLLHNNNFYSNFGYLTIILISALLVLL